MHATTSTAHPVSALSGATLLEDWGVIRARGDEAASFLHGQLSQDVASLGAEEMRLAAFCTAKGRMLASFVLASPAPGEVLLACSADVLPAALKRLSMFVLRSKAKLTDASGELAVVGLTGAEAEAWLDHGAHAPVAPVWASWEQAGGRAARLPDAALDATGLLQRRYLWIGPREAAALVLQALPALPAPAWQWLEVASGVARIEAATVEQFVPQMVNFELVGGVNFKKGCYPGQEIVARSQYLGKLKRRAVLLQGEAPMQAGQEVYASTDPGQPAGMVVNAAARPEGGHAALVEIKLAALDEGSLHLAAADGPLLGAAALPYALPDTAAGAEKDTKSAA